jgi:hypothetical protein
LAYEYTFYDFSQIREWSPTKDGFMIKVLQKTAFGTSEVRIRYNCPPNTTRTICDLLSGYYFLLPPEIRPPIQLSTPPSLIPTFQLYYPQPPRTFRDVYGSRLGHFIANYRRKCIANKTQALSSLAGVIYTTLENNGILETLKDSTVDADGLGLIVQSFEEVINIKILPGLLDKTLVENLQLKRVDLRQNPLGPAAAPRM